MYFGPVFFIATTLKIIDFGILPNLSLVDDSSVMGCYPLFSNCAQDITPNQTRKGWAQVKETAFLNISMNRNTSFFKSMQVFMPKEIIQAFIIRFLTLLFSRFNSGKFFFSCHCKVLANQNSLFP